MPEPTRSYRIPQIMLNALDARGTPGDSLNTNLVKFLGRNLYALYEARRRLAYVFTEQECGLLVDAMNGTLFADPMTIRLLPATIADTIEYDRLDAKWDVDGDALMAKLGKLSYYDLLCIVDTVEHWWNATGSETPIPHGDLFRTHPDNENANLFIG